MSHEILEMMLSDELQSFFEGVDELTYEYITNFSKIIHNDHKFERMFIASVYEGDGISNAQLAFGENQEVWEEGEWSTIFNEFLKGYKYKDSVEFKDERDSLAMIFQDLMLSIYGTDWIVLVEYVDDDNYLVQVIDLPCNNCE